MQNLRPDTSPLNLGNNASKAIEQRCRQNLQLPPTPTIRTSKSGTLATHNLSKHLTSEMRQRYHRKQRQPPFLLKAGLPLPKATKIGKPSFSEFLINPSWISKHSRTTWCKVRLTLLEWSRGHQVRPEPPLRTNKRVLTNQFRHPRTASSLRSSFPFFSSFGSPVFLVLFLAFYFFHFFSILFISSFF